MIRNQQRTARLLASAAVSALAMASQAHAGTLPLIGGVTDLTTQATSSLTEPLLTTVAETTTVTAATVTTIAPVTEPVLAATSPVVTTVSGATGTVTETVEATGAIVSNPSSTLSLLLPGSVFTNPEASMVDPKWGKIRSFWGTIRSFEGEAVSPFWGKIRSFWGPTGPFEGNVAGWWGDLRTFNDGTKPGSTAPLWSGIRTYWLDTGARWDTIRTSWDTAASSGKTPDYKTVASQLNQLVSGGAAFWGAAVKAQTGKDFHTGFANALLARYGIDLKDPATLKKLTVDQREHFFLEWYDGLMQFSGADNPDHWMRQVNWSPRLTETAGMGRDSIIGLLDFTVTGPESGNITFYDGVSDFANGHGAAVASLMVAAHDGKGVMGIAPMASVVAYNPFDETETAGWNDIRKGILALGSHGASIVNMSLGVSGWTLHPDWNAVFNDPLVALSTTSSVFVIAAGNDGISQTKNVEWTNSADFIVVGSVDPARKISEFSNRPGSACLTTNGRCSGDLLMNHFITAPGEMILVSDGRGGVTRYSGTSFAAPLVSGTIALIHDRWPWLGKHPKASIDIVLKSAIDLGAPGIDPVYGVGQLDVTKALSPLDYNNLTWYKMSEAGKSQPMSSAMVRSSADLARWEAAGAYFYAFETVGGSYRDFAIPLSTKLVDQSALSAGMTEEKFQAYLYNQVIDWLKKGSGFSGMASRNLAAISAPVVNPYGLKLTMSLAPRTLRPEFERGEQPYQAAFRLADAANRLALTVGAGDGAIELGESKGFGLAADYDPSRGGANPLLGMASGGGFAQLGYNINDALSLSAGVTQQESRYDRQSVGFAERQALAQLDGYRTAAETFAISYRPSRRFELAGSYTRLHERDAILGVQALDADLLDGGASTEGLTLAAVYIPTQDLQLAVSGTVGRTASNERDALIATGSGGFRSTAFQAALTKRHVFDTQDSLRLSVAQPLHVEAGKLAITSVQVVDRATGELGEITQEFALPGRKRPLVGEFHYARSLLDGQGDLALFGKAQLAGDPALDSDARVVAGMRFSLRY